MCLNRCNGSEDGAAVFWHVLSDGRSRVRRPLERDRSVSPSNVFILLCFHLCLLSLVSYLVLSPFVFPFFFNSFFPSFSNCVFLCLYFLPRFRGLLSFLVNFFLLFFIYLSPSVVLSFGILSNVCTDRRHHQGRSPWHGRVSACCRRGCPTHPPTPSSSCSCSSSTVTWEPSNPWWTSTPAWTPSTCSTTP